MLSNSSLESAVFEFAILLINTITLLFFLNTLVFEREWYDRSTYLNGFGEILLDFDFVSNKNQSSKLWLVIFHVKIVIFIFYNGVTSRDWDIAHSNISFVASPLKFKKKLTILNWSLAPPTVIIWTLLEEFFSRFKDSKIMNLPSGFSMSINWYFNPLVLKISNIRLFWLHG